MRVADALIAAIGFGHSGRCGQRDAVSVYDGVPAVICLERLCHICGQLDRRRGCLLQIIGDQRRLIAQRLLMEFRVLGLEPEIEGARSRRRPQAG